MTTDEERQIRVLIADDHAVVRQGLRAFLSSQGIEVIGEATNGTQAVELARTAAPDVIVMDLLMPASDGFDATREIRRVNPGTQIVILTSYTAEGHVLRALRAGALSYLPKESDPEEIAAAIRKAARGEAVIAPSIGARVIRRLASPPHEQASGLGQLTDRELEVLRLIADGLGNAAIAERLVISEGTVKTHVSSILGKLDLADRTQAAAFAWQQGLVDRAD
jgi:NarL family two-component system response regulator LiaR